ncbi:DNA-packaging protein [Clostridioides difficile]|nr:DNA-packaging protein [Clostridioides difficile]
MNDTIFPFMGVPEDYTSPSNEELPIFKEFAWDFEKNEKIIENGDFKVVERNEAVKVWIYKTIKTNKYIHLIYTWDYGTDIKNLIGQKYTKGLTESETKRYIQEALLINPYILEVNVTNTEFKDDNLSISLNVKTIYGEEEITFV